MEIADYLKVARRRLWVIVVIPLLAMAGVLANAQLSGEEHQATGYVFAPELLAGTGNEFSGPAGVAQWVNEFSATALAPRVADRVATQTGVPRAAIASGLEVTQLGQSGQLELTFTWPEGDAAAAVVQRVAAQTPKALFAPHVAQAERALQQSQDALKSVTQDYLDAVKAWQRTRPDLVYAGRLRVLAALQQERAAIDPGDEAGLTAADAKIARVDAQVENLGQDVLQLQSLRAERQAAINVLTRAQEDVQTARAQYAGVAAAQPRIHVSPVRPSSLLVKGLLSAVVAGLVIALCLVTALELLRGRREMPAVAGFGPPLRRPPTPRTAVVRVADMAARGRDG